VRAQGHGATDTGAGAGRDADADAGQDADTGRGTGCRRRKLRPDVTSHLDVRTLALSLFYIGQSAIAHLLVVRNTNSTATNEQYVT
jgi:hypothetical protein